MAYLQKRVGEVERKNDTNVERAGDFVQLTETRGKASRRTRRSQRDCEEDPSCCHSPLFARLMEQRVSDDMAGHVARSLHYT